VKNKDTNKPDDDELDDKNVEEEKEEIKDKCGKSDDEQEKESLHENCDESPDNFIEEKDDENTKIVLEKDENNEINKVDTENNVLTDKIEKSIIECSENKDLNADTISIENVCPLVVNNHDINEKLINSKEECEQSKLETSKDNTVKTTCHDDILKYPNNVDIIISSCNEVPQKKLSESEKESSIDIVKVTCDLRKSPKNSCDNLTLQQKVLPSNNVEPINDIKQNETVSNNYDKINDSIETETKQYNDQVLSSNFKENSVKTEIEMYNNPAPCNDFPKSEMTVQQPVSSINEKQYSNTINANEYCKPSSDTALMSNVKQYVGESLPNEYCKTNIAVQPNAKQYSGALLNEYRKLDMLQPEMNKQMYNKEDSVEYNKTSGVHPVPTNNSQEVFNKVVEQPKTKISDKNYTHSVGTDNTMIAVPKYDNAKHEKQSKRTTPSPKTLPYRSPVEVPQVEKPRLHDYLPPPMGFVNYQKINNSIPMVHSDVSKPSKDVYSDKKTDSVNMNMQKDKDVMNLPKSMDNSLLYSSVMQQSPYTDQSMMHLSLHHHLAHSTQYHHSPPVAPPTQVPVPPPPVHQTKSRSKKSEQRRLAQQNHQTSVVPSAQQQPTLSLPSHTQSSYHHHHQTATYMMPQPTASSPYHHSVIQHRMGQQGGSCSSADFYLSHSNQHAAAAAAQIASCNLSKLQQMTNGLDHHRRHISSPAASPASSPANMTPPPPPAASAAAAHLLQQSAVAYHKLYHQQAAAAGQTNQSRQYGHQSRGSPASPNVGLMSMQYGAPPPPPSPFNGYRVAAQSTPPPPPPSAAGYMNQTTGQLQYSTHSQDPHHQNSVYPASAYNGSYLQPLNGSMHR